MPLTVPCYLFDIDGTLADLSHRLHYIESEPKNWDAFFAACHADAPITHMCHLVRTLLAAGQVVLFVTGRSDRVRAETKDWLCRHLDVCMIPRLYMRKDGDNRSDEIVKAELLERIIEHGYRPGMVFEDRARVVAMWRAKGIPCAQVTEGDF